MLDSSHIARGRVLDGRWLSLGAALIAATLAAWHLDLFATLAQLVDLDLGLLARFFAAAISPALSYEGAVPAGTPPLLFKALEAARQTLIFALTGLSLALVIGVPLGIACTRSFWNLAQRSNSARHRLRRGAWFCARTVAALLRSVHELLFAILFLAALGMSELAAVIAIALPYGGILAKVFAELLDEAPDGPSHALAASGAGRTTNFFATRLPAALPNLCAYAFYRFECALRSAAVLGFFGLPTLGFFLAQAFENLHLRELWTYLYTLLLLVWLIEMWSGAIRRRLVA